MKIEEQQAIYEQAVKNNQLYGLGKYHFANRPHKVGGSANVEAFWADAVAVEAMRVEEREQHKLARLVLRERRK